jgi:hypothetical protein
MIIDYSNPKTPPPSKSHLRYGACSMFIGVLFATPLSICLIVNLLRLRIDWVPETLAYIIIALAFFGFASCLLGLALGIAGLYYKGSHRKWAHLGILANAAPILFICIGFAVRWLR